MAPEDVISILEGWESYESTVVPPDCHPTRLTETRRAFYAGARHLSRLMARMGEPDFSGADVASRMEAISRELEAFGRGVKRGEL